MSIFKKRESIEQVEESNQLAPKFDDNGLIPVITTDFESGVVLMHGYQNAEALELTIKTGEAHYWSRSRNCLWKKGETSGLTQKVIDLRIDDDQDAIWMNVIVSGSGASCHVGYKSCFYRSIPTCNQENSLELIFREKDKTFDPDEVYGDSPNPTKL